MIYLHIGRHKSGTTSLQHFLKNNPSFLADHGFSYAPTEPHHLAHHDLARAYMAGGDEASIADLPVVTAIKDHRPGDPHLIVSSEGFQNARPARLAEVVGQDATIVVYIREQLEYLVSAYLQRVQASALSDPLPDYMRGVFRTVNYNRFVASWEQVFSSASVRLRVFDRVHLHDNDIVADFLSVLGIDDRPAETRAGESNPSLTYPLLLLKRAANRNFGNAPFRLDRAFLAFDEWAGKIGGRGTRFPVDLALAEQVRRTFAVSNERLARRRFGRDELFQTRALPSEDHVPDGEIDDIVAHLSTLPSRSRDFLTGLIRDTARATNVEPREADVINRMAARI